MYKDTDSSEVCGKRKGLRWGWDYIERSALSPFFFSVLMDRLTGEIRQESPWTKMFADDIVICIESWEQMEVNLER